MDLVVNIPIIPKPGETLLGGVFNTFPGGKGANQAVAAARLGAQVTMVGCVGEDSFGKSLLTGLEAENINTKFVKIIPDISTGVALIQVDGNGQNSIAVASGANFSINSADVEKALTTIGEFDALIMPLESPLEIVYTGAKFASQLGAKVLLNPAPAQVLEKDLLQFVDVLIPNEFEVEILTEMKLQSTADLTLAADKLHSLGVKNLLVTLGKRGGMLFDDNEEKGMKIPAYTMQAVDTTAAGDCFVGAFAVGILEGKSLFAAANFASAAAAISVTRSGAQTSLPYRGEVEQFIQERSILQ